jgi:hypothetical protein
MLVTFCVSFERPLHVSAQTTSVQHVIIDGVDSLFMARGGQLLLPQTSNLQHVIIDGTRRTCVESRVTGVDSAEGSSRFDSNKTS